VRQFAQQESPAAARRLLRARSLEDLRWKVELAEQNGVDRLVVPSAASGSCNSADIYSQVIDNLVEAAEIAR